MTKLKWHSPGVAERVERLEKATDEQAVEIVRLNARIFEIEEALKEAYYQKDVDTLKAQEPIESV